MRVYKKEFLEKIDNEIAPSGNPICPWCEDEIDVNQVGVMDNTNHFLHLPCDAQIDDGLAIDQEYFD